MLTTLFPQNQKTGYVGKLSVHFAALTADCFLCTLQLMGHEAWLQRAPCTAHVAGKRWGCRLLALEAVEDKGAHLG